MEQAIKVLNMSKSAFRHRRRKSAGKEGERETDEAKTTPTSLFPLPELLEQLLRQEAELWRKNEGLFHANIRVGAGKESRERESAELSPRNTGPTPTPTPSLATTPPHTPMATPPLTSHPPPDPHDTTDGDQDRSFCLVQYGRLTEEIHRYFRRLEKRHACLYLTKRRAKHENLRHVETQAQSDQDGAPEAQSAGYLLNGGGEGDGQLVTLRDEELLVFRAALMCAQFPMLSAPSPPRGGSPTPTPPTFPLSTIGSPDSGDLSRTAPAEMHEDQMRQAAGVPASPSAGKASPRLRRSVSERVKVRGRPRGEGQKSLPEDETLVGVVSADVEGEEGGVDIGGEAAGRGRARPGLRRVSSTSSSSSRKMAKRLSMDAASLMPAVESDEDDELAELSRPRPLRLRDSAHLVGREHPFSPMVNREMLCGLVRRAFKQTEEQQLQFEQMLKHDYGRRSKGEILAKELAGQLQVLENNAHPFYKPKLFVTRNIGYEQWLQAEKQRVRSLIDKFWHFSLPRPQLWRHYNPTDYHRAYSLLLTRIICCESRTERKEPVHAGKTPSSPLSPTAQRLLNEFGLRYGVGELYRKIVYLDYLARHFDYEVWYIRHCTEELRAIRELLPRNRNKITAVRKEMDLLKTTVHLLHGQTDNCLTKIDRLFQDSPTEGVASLIELLAEVLDAEMSLFGKRVLTVEEWLKRYLKRGFALRYERRKEIHADETMNTRTAKPFVPTPALVNALLLSIKDEVKDYRDKFQPVFRRYFDIVPFARIEFYRLMCADACSLCLRTIHKPETRSRLNLEMLGLLYRLNERDSEWENVIPPDMQQWRHSFVDLSLIWMEVLGKQINKWVLSAVARDKWTLLTLSGATTKTDAGFPAHPVQTATVRAGISSSPFPSPGFTPMPNTPQPNVGSIGSRGAFMPYRKPAGEEERGRESSDRSGSSKRLSPADNPVRAVAEIPDLVMRGAHRSIPSSRPSPQENIMRFWQPGRLQEDGHHDNHGELEHSSTVEPAAEIEVCVSVYGSQEVSPVALPSVSPPASAGHKHTLHGTITQRETGTTSPDSSPRHKEPSPLPLPTVTIASVADTESTERGGRERGLTEAGSVEDDVSAPALVINTAVEDQRHRPVPSAGQGGDKELTGKSEDEKQPSSSHSDYRTPSPISDQHLQELSGIHHQMTGETPPTELVAGGNRDKVKEEEEKEEEHCDEVVFQPQGFPSADPVSSREEEGGVVKPKPHPVPPGKLTATLESDKPRVSSAFTVLNPSREPFFVEDGSTVSSVTSSFRDSSHHLQKEYSSLSLDRHSDVEESGFHVVEGRGGRGVADDGHRSGRGGGLGVRWNAEEGDGSSYLFPVSNSPVDLVTMLTRLASFTSTLLNTLTPTLRHGAVPGLDEPRRAHDYAPDVANAKRQASQQLKHVENTHTEFLKKLHKIMYSSLRLYADNLLCMDLCCWSNTEATQLLGSEMLHHLQRRRDTKEIWGCRHMVEVRHGLHPNGIPCHKKKNVKFESITRDMCLRINNIHLLIAIFPALEAHLHSTTRRETRRPVTAFGYISSDVADHPSPLHRHHPNSHAPSRYGGGGMGSLRSQDLRGTLTGSSDHSIMPRESSMSWGYSSREREVPRPPEKPESGFASRDSDQLLEYLHNVQKVQLKLLCSRMNTFFKPALSLLLELNLGDTGIERRLHPLVTFLTRHRSALRKYIYPECFHALMSYLWSYILQDLEEEAVKLRESKRPVTTRAQMILQALSHLMEFVHEKDEGVSLQTLTPSSEYLLALLDIMTRSTGQLITIFNKLSAPKFAMSRLDLSRSPVAVDTTVVHTLRSQIHTFKKCFSGKEFVEQFLKLGREAEALRQTPSEPTTPSPQLAFQRSPIIIGGSSGGGRHIFNSPIRTCPRISYTVHYAKDVGQFLLRERILLSLPGLRQESSDCYDSEEEEEEEEQRVAASRHHESSSIQSAEQRARQGEVGGGERANLAGDRSKFPAASSVENSPRLEPSRRRAPFNYRTDIQESDSTSQLTSEFVYSPQSLYKFADVEDFESQALYHSQILSASASPQAADDMEETTAFERARMGMLFLVHDLLVQRGRREKRVKQFLQTPRAVSVAERRKRQYVDCNLIFKM